MTIYFQGLEQEASSTACTISTTGTRYQGAWSRQGIFEGATINTGAGLSDFWASWVMFVASNIGSGNNLNTIYSLAGIELVRLRTYVTNLFQVEYWDGSTWINSGVNCSLRGVITGTVRQYVLNVVAGTSGEIHLWIDGVLQGSAYVDLSSLSDLSRMVTPTSTQIACSQGVIADETLLLWNVKTVPPTANGADTGGTGVIGDINEVTLNDSSYVSFDTAGQRRSTTAAARSLTREIKGVTVSGRLMRVDGTGPQKARPYVIVSGTRYYGTTFSLTVGFMPYQYTWDLNPSTGINWTTGEANSASLESGWEAVA